MRNTALTLLAGLLAMPLVACNGGTDPTTPDRQPFRDDWQTEADLPFEHTIVVDGEAMTQIGDIIIGGRESNDNFANRGDIIVNFDGPQDRILVEFRRFTTNTSREAAENDFEAMSLWAFNTSVGTPSKPDDMDQMANCVTGGSWQNACGVRVYYDGQSQLSRAGADIRVTLPADYRQSVSIITEDADEDEDYFNRGDVCVNGSNGTVDVEMQSGEAFIIVSDEATPAPTCGAPPNTKSMPSSLVEQCNNLQDDDGNNAAWSTDMGTIDGNVASCLCASEGVYGVVKVESDDSSSANITVDSPADLWAAITVENQGDNPDDCTATIGVPNLVLDEAVGNEFPWEAKGTVNAPSDAVTPGAGYNIQVRSGQCNPVAFTDSPDDFVGVNNGMMQDSEPRGNLTVCSDCLRGMTCDALIP